MAAWGGGRGREVWLGVRHRAWVGVVPWCKQPRSGFAFSVHLRMQPPAKQLHAASTVVHAQPVFPFPGPLAPHPLAPLQAVPSEMSIASVQKFLWKRSSEPVFEFRILDPAAPAPLPRLAPDA